MFNNSLYKSYAIALAISACTAWSAPAWAEPVQTAQNLQQTPPPAVEKTTEGQRLFELLQNHIISVSDQIKSTVTHIEVISKQGDQRRKGMGSGLIITPDGKIITNYHVIDRAQLITVILDDKSKYEATVVRRDQQTDLALLQIKPDKPLPCAALANSDNVKVGEWVVAIGNPYGFDRTVSFGIVSGKGRFIPGADNGVPLINDFIQTDALIDPGNSGGPLINMKGQVIGINSIGVGRGQGFTIPANIVREVINRTEVEGRIQRGWLGVYVQPVKEEYAKYVGQPNLKGILVSDTAAKGPARQAGLLSGDVITKFNGKVVNADTEEAINRFILDVINLEPGTKVPLEIVRNGKPLSKTMIIGTQPPVQAAEADTDYGFTVKQITNSVLQEYRLQNDNGVLVSYVTKGSSASEADIAVGDVIVKVDSTPVANVADFKKALKAADTSRRILVTLKRGQITHFALIDTVNYKKNTEK